MLQPRQYDLLTGLLNLASQENLVQYGIDLKGFAQNTCHPRIHEPPLERSLTL